MLELAGDAARSGCAWLLKDDARQVGLSRAHGVRINNFGDMLWYLFGRGQHVQRAADVPVISNPLHATALALGTALGELNPRWELPHLLPLDRSRLPLSHDTLKVRVARVEEEIVE